MNCKRKCELNDVCGWLESHVYQLLPTVEIAEGNDYVHEASVCKCVYVSSTATLSGDDCFVTLGIWIDKLWRGWFTGLSGLKKETLEWVTGLHEELIF